MLSEQITSANKYPSIFFAPNGDYLLSSRHLLQWQAINHNKRSWLLPFDLNINSDSLKSSCKSSKCWTISLTNKISSQEVIRNGTVQALSLRRIWQVSGSGGLNKLTVIPVSDLSTIRPPVHQVWGKIRPYSDPQQGRKPSDGRGPVLEHIMEEGFITRQDVLELVCSQTVWSWWNTTKEIRNREVKLIIFC